MKLIMFQTSFAQQCSSPQDAEFSSEWIQCEWLTGTDKGTARVPHQVPAEFPRNNKGTTARVSRIHKGTSGFARTHKSTAGVSRCDKGTAGISYSTSQATRFSKHDSWLPRLFW